MATLSTPGQRRKRYIKIGLVLMVVVSTIVGWYVQGPGQRLAKAAMADPDKIIIQADINDLYAEEERYRNFKGKRRTRTDYFAELSYTLRGNPVTEKREISEVLYDHYDVGEQMELWAFGPNQELVRPKVSVVLDANTSPLMRSMLAATISAIVAYGLSFILIPLFGREPDGYMPEGFYTDKSWLDIDDNQLISISDGELQQLKFDSDHAGKVQKAYQKGMNMEEIVPLAGRKGKLETIPLTQIVGITSRHYQDTFEVEWNEQEGKKESSDSREIEFLNPTVRTHAMEALKACLDDRFKTSVTHLGRFQSARPSLIGLVLALGCFWYFENTILMLLSVLAVLWTSKSFITRLWNPTVLTEVRAVEEEPVPQAG